MKEKNNTQQIVGQVVRNMFVNEIKYFRITLF